jgi:hypothetical protein
VTKDQIQELGMKRDQLRRERLARKDDNSRKSKVETARKFLFEKGIRPSSKKISNLLGEKSLTPNRVRESYNLFHSLLIAFRMHFLSDLGPKELISIHYSSSTSCMNLNWVFGKQHSLI